MPRKFCIIESQLPNELANFLSAKIFYFLWTFFIDTIQIDISSNPIKVKSPKADD